MIGVLPTYEQIGIWGAVLLTVLRIVQGIGVGGEWGGSVLIALERARADRRGLVGSVAAARGSDRAPPGERGGVRLSPGLR